MKRGSKVYIVVSREYEEAEIHSVFTSKSGARSYAKALNAVSGKFYGAANVEEWVVDKDLGVSAELVFTCRMDIDTAAVDHSRVLSLVRPGEKFKAWVSDNSHVAAQSAVSPQEAQAAAERFRRQTIKRTAAFTRAVLKDQKAAIAAKASTEGK